MAKNDKHGNSGDDMDMDFDDFNFDDIDGVGEETDDRSPRGKLKKFGSTLREEALSSNARRQYLEDSIPSKYHTTLNTANSIIDAGDDLYNDALLKEWDKSKGTLKKVVRAEGKLLRRLRLNSLVDWAEQREDDYGSDYDPVESEVQRGMGNFGGSVQDAMRGGQLSPRERQEMMQGYNTSEDIKETENENEATYRDTTVKQQTATVSLLNRILEANYRVMDYQDQIDFSYKKKMIEFNIRSLINQRKGLEQNALIRAELKEGLAAITKNTGLPDYVKITSQENAKRLLRDKMINQASDWAGSKISGLAKSFMEQTKRNIATMGMNFRDKAGMYADGKEMMDSVGMGVDELLMSMGASYIRSAASKKGGKYIRKFIDKNSKYTGGLDFTEALLANSGSYAKMATDGRSGYRKLDNFLNRYGYSGLGDRQSNRVVNSMTDKADEAAFMSKKLENTFLHAYPAWFNKIWKSIEGLRTGKDVSEIEDHDFDFKYNRLRTKKDLQTEFDNEVMDETRLHNYHDGIDNWIKQLDPKSTLSQDARKTIRQWLIENHSKGKESFAVSLYRGEGLPKGTSPKVRSELENKVPYLAGFDPLRVSMIMKEGVGLEVQALRENPEYRKKAKALGNADAQARARHPLDNRRLSDLTSKYGQNYLVDSGYADYDKAGNVNTNNDTITKMVLGGGMRNYEQLSNLDDWGDISTIEGKDPTKTVGTDDRSPIRRMGRAMSSDRYSDWSKQVLQNINGPRIRGFATGGFTSGNPDEVAGVTHGDEAVIDSTGTKNNKKLLAGIMKLGASVIKNGKLNRTYYKYLGFTSPEQVDAINNLKDFDYEALLKQAEELKDEKVKGVKEKVSKARQKFNDIRSKHFHNDGFDRSFGPTPDFMGPVRPAGFRQQAGDVIDLLSDRDEMFKKLKAKERLTRLKESVRDYDYSKIPKGAKEYAGKAKEAVRNANVSKRLDFDATRLAIENTLKEQGDQEQKLVSLFLVGQNSPFITKGDFATGRFRNKTDGSIISKPSDIMDDIILITDDGDFETVATMSDMLEGVFDSRGHVVKLIGLEDGYRKYLKRSTILGRAIKQTKIAQTIMSLKETLWDDKPVDVCIIVNGNLVTVLKASGFLSAQYVDKESGDVLKSHNDIRGEVMSLQGETLLTLDELSSGLFDNDGHQLKISKLKHWRNVVVGKIENFVKVKYGQLKEKALDKVLNFLEKKQGNDVYVMRSGPGGRDLVKAFTMEELKDGQLMLSRTSEVINKLSDITGPVYSKVTKSIVVKEDELEFGFFNENGKPYKDWKGLSIDKRLEHQKQRLEDKVSKTFNKFVSSFKAGFKGKDETEEEKGEKLATGDEPCDVYILQDGDLKKVLTKQGFLDHAYRDVVGNVITRPCDILSTVMSSAGRILLTTEQITNGLMTEDGQEIQTARKKAGPTKDNVRQNNPTKLDKLKGMLGFGKPKNTADGSKAMDILIMQNGKMKRIMTEDGWKNGSYRDKDGKVIKSPSDINGPVYNFRGDFVLTEDELQDGIYSSAGKLISTKFYKDNGLPGGKGIGKVLSGFSGRVKKTLGALGDKFGSLRKGSWQWMQAKKEEAERNKKGDVNVTVNDKDKDGKKGFLGKLLSGLGLMFGGMFTKMMTKFGKMFKNIRNAVLLSKVAGAAGGVLGGGAGGRGKMGLITKLMGAGVAAGGAYGAHQMLSGGFGDDDEDTDEMLPTPDEQKLIDAASGESSGGVLGTLSSFNEGTGGIAGDLAMTAAAGYGVDKLMKRRRAAKLNAARPGLASRFAGATGRGLGSGVRDAGKVGSGLGKVAAAIGKRLPGVGKLAFKGAKAVGKMGRWALSPKAAVGRLGSVGKIASMVGKGALGALKVARFLTGPVGLALGVATWVGGKLWENYKNKQNPLMRFRIAQYGFDFDDGDTTGKLLDLENLMKDHVSVNGEGQPSIKDSFPEDQVFELFGVNPEDPKNQEHMQRFIAWWIKRFKPVYLSYVKQTHLLLKKTDISLIDDELNKTDKLTLLKGVNFTNSQNNPYSISASPFAEPEEVTMTLDDVEKAHIKALKFINKMPDDKVTKAISKDGEDPKTAEDKAKEEKSGGMSWLSRSKEAVKDMGDETLKVTKLLAKKTDDIFGNWFSKASEKIKGLWSNLTGWLSDAAKQITDKVSAAWEGIKNMGSTALDKIAGSSTAGDMAVGVAEGVGNLVGGAFDSAKNALGFESNLGDGEKHILAAAKEYGITNPTELAALLATTAHESGNFRQTEENLRYSASALRKTWPSRFKDAAYAEQVAKGGPQAVANAVYGGRMGNKDPGDGWKYRGRGYIQLTGRDNYARFAKDTGIDALNNPDLVARPDIGAKAALWFWKKNGKISAAAQRGDITGVTKIVNGGTNGLSDRKSKFNKYLTKLQGGELKTDVAAPPVVAKTPAASSGGSRTSSTATPTSGTANAGTGNVTANTPTSSAGKVAAEANTSKLPEPNTGTQQQTKNIGKVSQEPDKGNTPPWMTLAKQELARGVGENKDVARANSYFADLGFPNYKATVQSWCAAFVSWCLKNSGTPYNTKGPLQAAAGYGSWGKSLPKSNPPYGAIVVVRPSHVFFCAGVEGGRVKALGGNQGKPGSVTISSFPLSSIMHVAWPHGTPETGSKGAAGSVAPSAVDVVKQQTRQAEAAEAASMANPRRLPEPAKSTPKAEATYQAAQQQTPQAMVGNNDANMQAQHLQEARMQTKLLTEIRDAVTGQRTDSNTMGDKTIGALGGLGKAQTTQVELIAAAVGTLTSTLADFRKKNKAESLSDQFPVSARK